MAYIKEDGKIYEVTTRKVSVDLEALRADLADLKAMEAPDDVDLIELGRPQHPYHSIDREEKIKELEAKIEIVEKVK